MIVDKINSLMCQTDRLAELMELPMENLIGYASRAAEVEPRMALHLLTLLYMDHCGEGDGIRSVIYAAADFWIEQMNARESFDLLMPELSGEYKKNREEYDKYKTIVLTNKDTRDIACQLLRTLDDDSEKIALCAGVMYVLQNESWPSIAKIGGMDLEEIENGILLLKNEELMRTRKKQLWHNRQADPSGNIFTPKEVSHLVSLNCKLIELQHMVFNQVSRITLHLQKEVASGNNDYEAFNVVGEIYVDRNDNAPEDSLQNILIDALPPYQAIITGSLSTQKSIYKHTCSHIHWWSNWDGNFKELVCKHNVPICRAFKFLLDTDSPFAIEDIMKISPEQFITKVTIHI